MSLFSVQTRKHTAYYDHLISTTSSGRDGLMEVKAVDTGGEAACKGSSRSSEQRMNRTYVLSAASKSGGGLKTSQRNRLTLQRRSRRTTEADMQDKTRSESSLDRTPNPEKRLTLQRRTRTPSTDKNTRVQPAPKVLSEPNGRTPSLPRSISVKTPLSSSVLKHPEDQTFKTPTRKTPFQKIAAKRDVFEKLASKDAPKPTREKSTSLEKLRVQQAENPQPQPVTRGVKPKPNSTIWNQSRTSSSEQKAPIQQAETLKQSDSIKMENSAVTVAVRVRPFSAREKTEKALQVIFMNGQETIVNNQESKQSYTFTYDYSLCSVDEGDPTFASQKVVYETLGRPLLLRALEGFNVCLFAYGQTGSGKSYTMMGFGEEVGVIPRFCQELFLKLASVEKEEGKCHVEMSYFEIYNEKIHDLLVMREEPNQRKMPLRVREHPVHGPYVAELSANVVSSYSDIQGWLELGNKQRATAATGMNDKSSRSHSVFSLVMKQTKTEFVEGEEHDHSISSRINLVDLAGSERSSTAQTSGDRLREGASINKSLLTLGKVISALSEQAVTLKKVFIPYRESVLTWLLKESLGGNSKTAMIATVSPAGSSVEESLSTLRYAQQARTIINVAKVNEDTSAKLIRELKAEVEKLRAAQMSSQGVEPQRVRMFQHEIAALKNKLCQQEKAMAEANQAWREKLEQAEIRKREETKELQKVGVTFKVDNRLPNLVNLNEDPQLSEMLLYMIKEGQTTVGKLKPVSSHDIQLTGALIADQHCIISNIHNTVSITPMEHAKTFVNGDLISESTVLHHGDRVILGGDHYFRFNHPAEVQSGKRVSCWTVAGDGHKDFEFAKNELLAAQRAKLEAEIEEAQLKAKQEMMQGIQMAKEVAQKELSDQRALYEDRIKFLERELNEETERKRKQELDHQRVANQMAELKVAKLELEKEVDSQKKRLRLHVEAQAMEDHRVCQAKIVEALEAEKRKISEELEEMQKKRTQREKQTIGKASPQWDAMKLSLMIEEANKISVKLRKHTVFSRHEDSEQDDHEQVGLQVRVQNMKLGISTIWSLDKFQNNMAAMRELEQGDPTSKDDVFYDPSDEWEQDISASSASTTSFSRRRSRSLLKCKRISGRLYEIRVHPIQSLASSAQTAGLMYGAGRSSSSHSSTTEPAVPGICKQLIGQSMSSLHSTEMEESLADRLISNLNLVYKAVQTISDLYDALEDDAQDSVFASTVVAQTELIKATAALNNAVLVTSLWLTSAKPCSGLLYTLSEELKCHVKKMGGFFQMLIQGCESEITSMVVEARRKSGRCLDAAMHALAHIAVVTGTPLSNMGPDSQATGKESGLDCLLGGTNKGIISLLEESLSITKEMLKEAQLAHPTNTSLKVKTVDAARTLQNYIQCLISERDSDVGAEEGVGEAAARLQRLRSTSARLFQLNQAVQQLHCCLSAALRGKDGDSPGCRGQISASAEAVAELLSALLREAAETPHLQLQTARDELHSALQHLASLPRVQRCEGGGRASGGSEKAAKRRSSGKGRVGTHSSNRERVVSKIVLSLAPGGQISRSPHWV